VTVDKELFADNLPTYLTRFVGRDREISAVLSMLHPGRLATICGVGGAGKTRLAIEVAKRHRVRSGATQGGGEVYWVPLAAVVDPSEVPTTVATGIGLAGQDRPLAPVLRALRDRQALLVMDNCEQVAGACQELLASLLAACPGVTVLATSRVPLGLPAEEVCAIPPMAIPPMAIPPMAGAALRQGPPERDATALFLDRATSVAGASSLTEHNAKASWKSARCCTACRSPSS
jgi:predicted ATPase